MREAIAPDRPWLEASAETDAWRAMTMASWFMSARAASHSTVCGKSTMLALAIPATPHAW